MTFCRSIELTFSPASFASKKSSSQSPQRNSAIRLTYIGDDETTRHRNQPHYKKPTSMTTIQRFFLQILRANLQGLHQSSTRLSALLSYIARSWDLASAVDAEVERSQVGYITDTAIVSDDRLKVSSTVFLEAMRTKVHVTFNVQAIGTPIAGELQPLRVAVRPAVKVVYGEALKEGKMTEFMDNRLAGWGVEGEGKEGNEVGMWARAVRELEDRCRARGKKS